MLVFRMSVIGRAPGFPVGATQRKLLPIRRQTPGFVELASEAMIHYDRRSPPFRPVSTDAYARAQLAVLTSGGAHDGGPIGAMYRRRLASWTPAERATPACIVDPAVLPEAPEDMIVAVIANCPRDRRVVEIDQAGGDRTRPAEIQLIALHNPPRASLESDRSWRQRRTIWEQLDQASLRALIDVGAAE